MVESALDGALRRRPRVLSILQASFEVEDKLLAVGKGETVPGIKRRICECGDWHGDFEFEAPTTMVELHAAAVVALVQQLAYLEEKSTDQTEFEHVLGSVMATITKFDKLIALSRQIAAYKGEMVAAAGTKDGHNNPGGMYS